MNTFSHSGDFGDILAHLPIIQAKGGGKLVLYPAECTGYRMTQQRAASLAKLLKVQPYITDIEWRERPVGIVLDDWRNGYCDGLNLTDMACKHFNVKYPDREQPWLHVAPKKVARVVFSRTQRYSNPNFPWHQVREKYYNEAVFVGSPEEHRVFCSFFGPVSYCYTEDMLALAQVIRGAELFVGNQSSPYWVAEGLKIPTLLEITPSPNNCHWERRGNQHGWNRDVYLPELSDLPERLIYSTIGRAVGHTLLTEDRLSNIARHVRDTANIEGDMAELGSFRGGSAKLISSFAPTKTLHLFDTFEGIPEDDELEGGHKKGDFIADAEEVRRYLQGYKVQMHAGIFPSTAASIPGESKFSFVHLDADIYQSTKAGIEYFWPRLVPGGLLVLDDYGWPNCPGVEKAVRELLPDVRINIGTQQAWCWKGAPA